MFISRNVIYHEHVFPLQTSAPTAEIIVLPDFDLSLAYQSITPLHMFFYHHASSQHSHSPSTLDTFNSTQTTSPPPLILA